MFGTLRDKVRAIIQAIVGWTETTIIGHSLLMTGRVVWDATTDVLRGDLQVRAASLVYSTLLALVPLIAVSFSVLKGFGVQGQMESLIGDLFESVGDDKDAIVRQITAFVDKVDVVALGGVGLAFLFYTVFSLVRKIEASVNHCWRVLSMRSFTEGFPRYISIILIGPVLLFAATTFSATIRSEAMFQEISRFPGIADLIDWGGQLLPYGMMVLVFSGIFYFLPNTNVRIRPALAGGLVTAFLWFLVSQLFATLVAGSGTTLAIYATFATMIIFMLWLFVAWLVLLYGASIAFYAQNPAYTRISMNQDQSQISGQARERVALIVMKDIVRTFARGEEAPTINRMADRLDIPIQSVDWVVDILLKARLLTATQARLPGFVPARASETIKVKDVLSAVRRHGHDARGDRLHRYHDSAVDAVMRQLDEAQGSALDGMTLRDLAEQKDETGKISPIDENRTPPSPATEIQMAGTTQDKPAERTT